MTYKTITDIHKALWEQIKEAKAAVGEDNFDAQRDWHSRNDKTEELMRLFNIYHDAYDNPPEGVIGVGAITYAEMKLMEAQQ